MEVHALPAAHDGLARYRITMPERPGRYAILEVPADADDQVGLVELLITLFVFVTAPVSANLMAQAALHLRVTSQAPIPDHAVPERHPAA